MNFCEEKGACASTSCPGSPSAALSSVENWLQPAVEREASPASPPVTFTAGIGQQVQNFVDGALTSVGGPVRHHLAMDPGQCHVSSSQSAAGDADMAPADVAPADVAPADVAIGLGPGQRHVSSSQSAGGDADMAPADLAPADVAPADVARAEVASTGLGRRGSQGAQARVGCVNLGTAVASAIGRSSLPARSRQLAAGAAAPASMSASTSASRGQVAAGAASTSAAGRAEEGNADLASRINSLVTWPLRMLTRLKTTLKGSSGDIGWLRREPGLPPVTDGTERFVQHVALVLNGVHTLPDSLVYLLVPGMFSNMGSLYFASTKRHLNTLGLACHIAKIHSEAAVETNANELRGTIEELHWGSGGKRVLILGHSKGGVDAAAACSLFWDSLRDKIAGIVLVQSPYGGTPVASDLLRRGQLGETESRTLTHLIISRLFKGDLRALEDITYEQRRQFLQEHPLPLGIPIVSFHTEAPKDLAVLTELSHIHAAQVPVPPSLSSHRDLLPSSVIPALEAAIGASSSILPSAFTSVIPALEAAIEAGSAILPVTLPASALLATLAWKLELRYGAKSDGLVTRDDAEVPGSLAVRPQRKMDHAWPVYASATRKDTGDNITAPQLCEALISLLLETWPPPEAPQASLTGGAGLPASPQATDNLKQEDGGDGEGRADKAEVASTME